MKRKVKLHLFDLDSVIPELGPGVSEKRCFVFRLTTRVPRVCRDSTPVSDDPVITEGKR